MYSQNKKSKTTTSLNSAQYMIGLEGLAITICWSKEKLVSLREVNIIWILYNAYQGSKCHMKMTVFRALKKIPLFVFLFKNKGKLLMLNSLSQLLLSPLCPYINQLFDRDNDVIMIDLNQLRFTVPLTPIQPAEGPSIFRKTWLLRRMNSCMATLAIK